MKKLKVALIQYDTITPDIEQNTITAIKLIREAISEKYSVDN